MSYVRSTDFATSMRPEYKTGRFYTERAKKDTVVGTEYWFDGRDLGLFSDLPYGQDRFRVKCLSTYTNGALFSVKCRRAVFNFFLGWWEVWRTIHWEE